MAVYKGVSFTFVMTSCVTPILDINVEEYSISKLGNLGEKG